MVILMVEKFSHDLRQAVEWQFYLVIVITVCPIKRN